MESDNKKLCDMPLKDMDPVVLEEIKGKYGLDLIRASAALIAGLSEIRRTKELIVKYRKLNNFLGVTCILLLVAHIARFF